MHTVRSLDGDEVTDVTTYTVGRGSGPRTLSDLDDAERYAAYEQLQNGCPTCGTACAATSVTSAWSWCRRSARTRHRSGTLTQAMEERSLFLLLLLRQPRLRMIYVTSNPVSEAVVEYYLGLLPGVIPHTRAPASPWWRSTTRRPAR